MKQLTILLMCLLMGLTACSPNDKSNLDVSTSDIESAEVAEKEQPVEENTSTEDTAEHSEDVTEVETVTYEYTVPTFDEIFDASQPTLKVLEKDVVLGITTIQDLIGYNQLGDDDKYVSAIQKELIPPYTAYEFVLEDLMYYDATVTLYGYNFTNYYFPANMLPIFGVKVNTTNMNEWAFHADTEGDSIQLEAEDFTFSYKIDTADDYEASIELIPNPELAVKYMQATKGTYIPKDFKDGMELTETQFVVDGKIYDFNEVKYFHMISFERLPKLVVVYGKNENRRTYEFDKECEILVDGDTFFTFNFPEICDVPVDNMLDIYSLAPENVSFNIIDQATHEFKYGKFNSFNMEKGTVYEDHTDNTDISVEYINNVCGKVTVAPLLPKEVIDSIKFTVGSN